VTVHARNNQVLARAYRREGRAAAWTPGAEPFVSWRNSTATFLLDLARTAGPGRRLGGAPYLARPARGGGFSERGVYRPGEKIFAALVRDDRRQAPEPFPALLRVRRPDGRIFRDVPVELDEFGSATAEVEMPDYLPTGRYELEWALPGTFTVLGATSVALEDFVPPQIRVDVKPPEGRGRPATSGVRVDAATCSGGRPPASRRPARRRSSPRRLAPSNWPAWTFGDPRKAFRARLPRSGARILDENGAADSRRKAARPGGRRPPCMWQQATVWKPAGAR
jgi:hypothetical protein